MNCSQLMKFCLAMLFSVSFFNAAFGGTLTVSPTDGTLSVGGEFSSSVTWNGTTISYGGTDQDTGLQVYLVHGDFNVLSGDYITSVNSFDSETFEETALDGVQFLVGNDANIDAGATFDFSPEGNLARAGGGLSGLRGGLEPGSTGNGGAYGPGARGGSGAGGRGTFGGFGSAGSNDGRNGSKGGDGNDGSIGVVGLDGRDGNDGRNSQPGGPGFGGSTGGFSVFGGNGGEGGKGGTIFDNPNFPNVGGGGGVGGQGGDGGSADSGGGKGGKGGRAGIAGATGTDGSDGGNGTDGRSGNRGEILVDQFVVSGGGGGSGGSAGGTGGGGGGGQGGSGGGQGGGGGGGGGGAGDRDGSSRFPFTAQGGSGSSGGVGGNGGDGGDGATGEDGGLGGIGGDGGAGGGAFEIRAMGSINFGQGLSPARLIASGADGKNGQAGSQSAVETPRGSDGEEGKEGSRGYTGKAGENGGAGGAGGDGGAAFGNGDDGENGSFGTENSFLAEGGGGGGGGQGGEGGKGGRGGDGGNGGYGGDGGGGGGGAGGTVKIFGSVVTGAPIVDSSGGQGGQHGDALRFDAPDGANGKLIFGDNTGSIFEGTSVNTTVHRLFKGTRAENPFLASAAETPNLPGLLTGGAEAFGIMDQLTSIWPQFDQVSDDAPTGAVAALYRLDEGPSGFETDWAAHDMLLYLNLREDVIEDPSFGAGAVGHDQALLQGGFSNDQLFGGSGDTTISSLEDFQIYATLIPNSTSEFTIAGDNLTASTSQLFQGQALYLIQNEVDVSTGNTAGTILGGLEDAGGIEFNFDDVTSPGSFIAEYDTSSQSELATVLEDIASGASNINFQLTGDIVQFWDITFDGQFTGQVEVTFAYDDSLLNIPESEIAISHYNESLGDWEHLTVVSRDPILDTITVLTNSFSPFVLSAVPEPSTLLLASLGLAGLLTRRRVSNL